MSDALWEDMLLAYLHDPPSKCVSIRDHVSRARRLAEIALGYDAGRAALKVTGDPLAAAAERLPMPTAGERGERAVEPKDGFVRVRHPLSGDPRELAVDGGLEDAEHHQLEKLLAGIPDDRRLRFLAVWRAWRERLDAVSPGAALLPADTRMPDHTLWNHLDTTAAFQGAASGEGGPALLSFSIGPVQSFIAAARSLRDLWTGSMMLSWLVFEGMKPVLEAVGPTAFVFPSLRGLWLVDAWLAQQHPALKALVGTDPVRRELSPVIPNKFLALVPYGADGAAARALAAQVEEHARKAWHRLERFVHEFLHGWAEIHPGWDDRWEEQVRDFFDVRTSVLPLRGTGDRELCALLAGNDRAGFEGVAPDAAQVRRLADRIAEGERPGYSQKQAGRWQAQVELAGRMHDAAREVRLVRVSVTTHEQVPPKCTLFGDLEQMGPAGLDDSGLFWEKAAERPPPGGGRVRKGERFSAPALVKRFGFLFFAREFEANHRDLAFADTATLAAAEWLAGTDLPYRDPRWSGQWLHWPRRDFDDEAPNEETWRRICERRRPPQTSGDRAHLGLPPAYYAVLHMDGDEMGGWLRGKKSPTVANTLHERMLAYYREHGAAAAELEALRPVTPFHHAAISEALGNFSQHVVPELVERHHGELVYAGGDDVLALLPAAAALPCAQAIRLAWSGLSDPAATKGWYLSKGRELLTMGPKASMSAGIAVVHYKEDLRLALQRARDAEKAAKNAGRNRVAIAACRRSGEHAQVVVRWGEVVTVQALVAAFRQGASDRWVYHLRASEEVLAGLPPDAQKAEIRRQVARSEPATLDALNRAFGSDAQNEIAALMDRLASDDPAANSGEAFARLVRLTQTASFLARGSEE